MKSNYQSAFGSTMGGIVNLFRGKRAKLRLDENDRLDGKTCMVTGANSGLGKAVTQSLLERGATVIMACRSESPQLLSQWKTSFGESRIQFEKLDLSRLDDVLAFSKRLQKRGQPIQIAVFNAGVVTLGARKTSDGFDEMFQVHFLANFLLAAKLLELGLIAKDPQGDSPSPRMVFVNSETHRSSNSIAWDNLGEFQDYGLKESIQEYGRTKLLQAIFAKELSRRLAKQSEFIAVHAICPGAVNTNIARNAPGWSKLLLKLTFPLFFQSPRKAALPLTFLCCSKTIEGKTGLYMHMKEVKTMSDYAKDPIQGKKLWDATEILLANYLYNQSSIGIDPE